MLSRAEDLLEAGGLSVPDMKVLSAVVDAAPSRVSVVTTDLRYLYANREFLGFVGLTLPQLVGKHARDLLGPEVYEAFKATAASVTPTDSTRWEGWISFARGGRRFLQVAMAPYAPQGRDLEAIFVFSRDLTELKTREVELQESLQRATQFESVHRAMVGASLDCIVITDENGALVEFNPAAEEAFGRRREDVLGAKIVKYIVPEGMRLPDEGVDDLFHRLVSDKFVNRRLVRQGLRANGEVFPIEITVTLLDVEGRRHYVAHCRDLSEEYRQREEIARRGAALLDLELASDQIIQSAIDAFVLADDKGRLISFNAAAEQMLGFTREEAIGRRLSELMIPHAYREAHEAGMARYMAGGESRVLGKRLQLEALCAKGELIPIEVTLTEVKVRDRRMFAAHMRDLRETRRAQSEIERQRERIHQVEKLSAMGSLLAGVAHELNNPLAILVAQSTLLKDKAPTDDVRQRADRIHAAAERAGRIIKSFLAMARQKPPSRAAANLNTLITETLEMLAYGLRSAGVEITRELDASLPNVNVDGDMIRQVLANVVINSQQALANAEQPRKLTVRSRTLAGFIAIDIADNGPGVPAEVVSRIFDPFFTTKPAGVGTGIGLAICKDIVQAHDGTLELIPTQGRGAHFRITLPIGESNHAEAEQLRAPEAANRILIVDDEPDVGGSLGEILESMGQSVVVLDSAKAALELLGRERFDRVFVDLRMPEMSGHAFIKRVAAIDHRLAARAVLMTGDTVRGPQTVAGEHAPPIMEKPFTFEDVRAMLAVHNED
jgi:PAS domain S-box-containing protein